MNSQLTLEVLHTAVAGGGAAFRARTELQPAGGPGDKVFPATYEKGQYATEERVIAGTKVPCVLIDSVQSQANRSELVLLDAVERKRISLPLISVAFDDVRLRKRFRVTSLDAPHRIADAIFRDSLASGGTPFRKSAEGSALDEVSNANATKLFELCPTALIFGLWDSTGPRGGLGAKFQRALVSEIVGINAHLGKKTSSRIDPTQITKTGDTLFLAQKPDDGLLWVLDPEQAAKDKNGKPIPFNRGSEKGTAGEPSKANLGNVTPTITEGGFTIDRALQTTVLSLPALRRLRFPIGGATQSTPKVDDAARTALAALALCAATLQREQGADLRSRCFLISTAESVWELIGPPGTDSVSYLLTGEESVRLLNDAVKAAIDAGLPWRRAEVELTPSPGLLELVIKSQNLAASVGGA